MIKAASAHQDPRRTFAGFVRIVSVERRAVSNPACLKKVICEELASSALLNYGIANGLGRERTTAKGALRTKSLCYAGGPLTSWKARSGELVIWLKGGEFSARAVVLSTASLPAASRFQ
jgi:hypothetical protein